MLFTVHSMLQYSASIPVQYLHCYVHSVVTFRYCGTVPALPYSVRSEVLQCLYRGTVHSSLTAIYSSYNKSDGGYYGS
jgi:hypothetical protein